MFDKVKAAVSRAWGSWVSLVTNHPHVAAASILILAALAVR